MGGWRCTYRNCCMRSDGQTHIFHYPVFDKVRCHQWLVNAQKLEFLELKVSQLKNRVVCQNHFTDDMFMNFKKDKLKFNAVPTRDGPYCDSQVLNDNYVLESMKYPISLDDIENENLTSYDKKANFKTKYGDFLTNSEVMDLDTVEHKTESKFTSFRSNNNNILNTEQSSVNFYPDNNTEGNMQVLILSVPNTEYPKEGNEMIQIAFENSAQDNREKPQFEDNLISNPLQCSYRNCSTQSDGNVNMFHYPVLDGARCHRWLINAHKLEFLDLKVSQLKNKTVCQYHFKDDDFIDFKKNELKRNAVPTEDGPYCNSEVINENNTIIDSNKYSVSLADIENHNLIFDEKKPNNVLPVTYSESVTNFEAVNLNIVNPKISNNIILNTMSDGKIQFIGSHTTNNPLKHEEYSGISPSCEYLTIKEKTPTVVSVEFDVPKTVTTNHRKIAPDTDNTCGTLISHETQKTVSNRPKGHSKVKILSEKKIENPVPIIGKMNPVSPSLIIKIPDKTKTIKNDTQNDGNILKQNNTKLPTQPKVLDDHNNHKKSIPTTKLKRKQQTSQLITDKNVSQNNENITLSEQNVQIPNSKVLEKNKISPERLAAIEQKRQFNMKMKNIVEICLDKLDDDGKNKQPVINLNSGFRDSEVNKQVDTFLSNDPQLPNIEEYTMARLEARIKRMEDTLLNKIGNNTKRIIDLKNTVTTKLEKKSIHTQTVPNEESYKKYLYQELSKYLSPNVNNLVYEELFINKYEHKYKCSSSPKKRKCR